MTNASPSIDPANNGTLVGAITFAFNKLMQNINHMLPAQVMSYDRVKNTVQVQLLINIVDTNGNQYSRPQLAAIPVFLFGGGGFSISFPLNSGDQGWVLANDRDISLYLQTYDQAQPNTARMMNFSDGVFFPDAMKSQNITDDNKGYVLIQSMDGVASVQMGVNTTTGATELNIIGDRININPTDSLLGFVAIDGNLAVSGTIIPNTPIVPYPP